MPKLENFTGVVTAKSELTTFGQNNTPKQSITVNTGDKYNPMIQVDFIGKTTESLANIQVGQSVELEGATLGGRESNLKVYHSVNGYKIKVL